jgi:hypothetical protein
MAIGKHVIYPTMKTTIKHPKIESFQMSTCFNNDQFSFINDQEWTKKPIYSTS